MDEVAFSIGRLETFPEDVLDISVNGQPLPKFVAAIERPFAEAEGKPDLAGSYSGLVLGQLETSPRDHLLGSPGSHLQCGPHDKTVLLGCGCGEPGCWPLMARVDVNAATVAWTQFEQPHRRDRWSYEGLSLVFDRRRYEAELERARPLVFAAVARVRTADELVDALLEGDKRALARAISLVENNDPEGWELVRRVYPETGKAAMVGFTGPPGVGKSTLIGALVKHVRGKGRDVAVLSIDPSSPFTHGALLGDRIRLVDHFLDPGVFIRSMASRGSLGGLSEATLQAALLMDAAGNDDVFLETVGVGQAEVDIIDHADTVVLVLMPGSGDSIQALKAGVMEIPDVIVVNKKDHPLTDTMVREIRGVLSLGPQHGWRVPIVQTDASRAEGVEELAAAIEEHRAHIEAEGTLEERRRRNLRNEVLELATVRLRRELRARVEDDPEVQKLLDEVVKRKLDPATAATKLLEREP